MATGTSASIFPAETKDAEQTYKRLVDRGKEVRAYHQTGWSKTLAYLQGYRNLSLDFKRGLVRATPTDKNGRLKFVYEQLLATYQSQMGRLLGMDLSPRVVRRNDSLDGQRAAAIDQAVLTHSFPASRVRKAQRTVLPPFLFYGTVGLTLWENPADVRQQDLRVLPPWQLTPIPPVVASPADVRGLIIRRRVPVEELKRMFQGAQPRRGALAEAQRQTVPRGDLPAEQVEMVALGTTLDALLADAEVNVPYHRTDKGADAGKTDQMEVVWLGNVFLWDERDYLTEQLVFVGEKFYFRDSFALARRCRPVTTLHSIDTGGFYSRSWMELQIPLNAELEGAVGRSFQNVKEMDQYGVPLIPTNFGLNRQAMIAKDGIKFMPYEWDQLTPANQSIVQLQPANSGGFPVKMIQVGAQLSDRLANQPQAMMRGDAPGRMDNAAGLGTLIETSNVPLAADAAALAAGFSDIYRAALARDLTTWQDVGVVAITLLDDSLAGIVYDPKGGTISLKDNAIVHPDEVEVTVQSMLPISKTQQVLELKDHLGRGLITPLQYRVKARIMNLELPVANEQEWESYKKARLENVLLYHDGRSIPEGSEEQVGVLFSAEGDLHEVHLMVHMELVATTKFSLAHPLVRQRILDHIEYHKTDGLGQVPEGIPPLEDAAQQAMMMPRAGMQGGGGMMGPGGAQGL